MKNAPFFNDQTIKPEPDLSVVPSHGDVDVTIRIRVFGTSDSDSVLNRVMDERSFDGGPGSICKNIYFRLSQACENQAIRYGDFFIQVPKESIKKPVVFATGFLLKKKLIFWQPELVVSVASTRPYTVGEQSES